MKAKGKVVGRKRVGRMRPGPNPIAGGVGVPDGFSQRERELMSKYPGFCSFIARRVAEERRKAEAGLIPNLDAIEDEIRRQIKRRPYNSRKPGGKQA